MRKGFTLIELVVAVAILGMVLLFAGTIFKVSIEAHRTAIANAEILQKLRAITDQINADFKGVRREFPHAARGYLFGGRIRSDCIAFLANGDFQSTGQPTGKTIVGNVASIFYGHATTPDPATALAKDKILIRRQKILTSDSTVPPPVVPPPPKEEYCRLSLAEWRATPAYPDPNVWVSRTTMDASNPSDLVMYMAKGVDDFAVQFAQWNAAQMRYAWWPENGDFVFPVVLVPPTIATPAIKFTFTLYDSKGVIRNGRTFTHIVYIGD